MREMLNFQMLKFYFVIFIPSQKLVKLLHTLIVRIWYIKKFVEFV